MRSPGPTLRQRPGVQASCEGAGAVVDGQSDEIAALMRTHLGLPVGRKVSRGNAEGRRMLVAGARLGDVGDIGRIAQSQVEPLRADRWQHVSGFADQRDTMAGELVGTLAGGRPTWRGSVRVPTRE